MDETRLVARERSRCPEGLGPSSRHERMIDFGKCRLRQISAPAAADDSPLLAFPSGVAEILNGQYDAMYTHSNPCGRLYPAVPPAGRPSRERRNPGGLIDEPFGSERIQRPLQFESNGMDALTRNRIGVPSGAAYQPLRRREHEGYRTGRTAREREEKHQRVAARQRNARPRSQSYRSGDFAFPSEISTSVCAALVAGHPAASDG